ncbi:MAG TPA: hypothetical protein VJ752_12705 [Burkholderiaceae bacterium]|nr:hypothetical protein [Burkholderiaceae bacterium]
MQPSHAIKPAKRRVPLLPGPLYLMKLTVAAESVTMLRQIVSRVCGDDLQFMRIEHCAQTRQTHVCLCIAQRAAEPMLDAVALYLPDAHFGTIREPKLRYLVRSLRDDDR